MPNPEDTRDSQPDADDARSLGDYFPPDDPDRATGGEPQRSAWLRLRTWLFNVIPVALSMASALLVLYLLAKLTGLR